MGAVSSLLPLILLFTLFSLISSQSFTPLTSSSPSITTTAPSSNSTTCYSYATGALTSQSDFSVVFISLGNPTAYISLTPTPAPTTTNTSLMSIFDTGSVLLQTSQNVSQTPVNLITTAGATVYVCVVFPVFPGQGQGNLQYTLAFSSTQRVYINGAANTTVTFPAAAANTVQYVAWRFPLDKSTWQRGFYSFTAAYTTNYQLALNLTLWQQGGYSLAAPSPAILWSHDVWQQSGTAPPQDVVIPQTLATFTTQRNQAFLNALQGIAVITFDRDQTYTYSGESYGWYVFAVFTPYAVPSGVFALTNVFTAATATAASDTTGDDIASVPLPAAGASGVSIAAGQVQLWSAALPITSGQTATVTLTSVTGNADLYLIRTAELVGAPLDINGQAIDASAPLYGGGANVASNGYWLGSDVQAATQLYTAFDFQSTNDNANGVDSISFVYTSPNNSSFWTIVVAGQRAATYALTYTITPAFTVTNMTATNQNPSAQVTVAQAAPGTVAFYQYYYNGQLDALTDLSLAMIAPVGTPTVYISTVTQYPSAASYQVMFTNTGSAMLHTGNLAAKQIINSTGVWIYIGVVAGASISSYSLSWSSTERILWTGIQNQTAVLNATRVNTLQCITWSFPPQTSGGNRGYYSFALSYTTNTSNNNLGGVQGLATSQAAIVWQHSNYYQSNVEQPDPTLAGLPTSTNQNNANVYQGGAFVTFDRDQSYPYTETIEWYSFCVWIPYRAPAGGIVSLVDVIPAAQSAAATDAGGADLSLLPVSIPNTGTSSISGAVSAGGLDLYNLMFPTSLSTFTVTVRVVSYTGNADIFLTPTPTFVGATYYNYSTGLANDIGNTGYAQGANLGTLGVQNGAVIATYTVNTTRQTGGGGQGGGNQVEQTTFTQNGLTSNSWVLVVFGQTAANYTVFLSVSNSNAAAQTTLTTSGITAIAAVGAWTWYQYTVPTITSSNDLAFVMVSKVAAGAQGAMAYFGLNNYPSTFAYATGQMINTTGSLLVTGATGYVGNVYTPSWQTGALVHIGVYNPSAVNVTYTLSPSITTRTIITGLSNQSVTLPALAANSITYLTWNFPEATTGGNRGYYSFAAGWTANVASSSLGLSASNPSSVAAQQPTLFWSHSNFNAYSGGVKAIPDPTLPSTIPITGVTSSSTAYTTAALAVFDRDQSYPSTPATVYYAFAVYTPYAVSAGSVFTISNVGSSAAAATDAGGDDFALTPLAVGTSISGAVGAGVAVGYKVGLPASTATNTATFSLTSTSGNADLFVVGAQKFYGAAVFNNITGSPNDTGNIGWGQGGNGLAGSGAWVGVGNASTFAVDYSSVYETSGDSVSIQTGGANIQWYVVIVYGQLASTYTLSVSSTAISYTELSGSNGQTTSTTAANTIAYYSYTLTAATAPTANTDMGVLIIPTAGNPYAYINIGSAPSTSSYVGWVSASNASFLLHSSTSSSNAVAYVPHVTSAAGQVVTIAVVAGASSATYTLAVSSSTRIVFSDLVNQTSTLPATPANTLQYITWTYPLLTGLYLRDYMSFAASYTSNQAASALSLATTPSATPVIQWTHDEWAGVNYAPPDPMLKPVSTAAATTTSTRTGVFNVYNRDQSYPYSGQTTSGYVFLVYIPYAVPAGGVVSLSSVDAKSAVANASDAGGDDFATTPLTLNAAATTASITVGSVVAYSLALPPATAGSVTVTLMSTSGQSYLYAAPSQAFYGAPALDNITGAVVENGLGYNQGALWSSTATYGYYEGSAVNVSALPMAAAADGTTNTLTFTYTGTLNTFYTVVVFGQRAGAFSLAATGPTTPLVRPSSTAGAAVTTAPTVTSAAAATSRAVTSAAVAATSTPVPATSPAVAATSARTVTSAPAATSTPAAAATSTPAAAATSTPAAAATSTPRAATSTPASATSAAVVPSGGGSSSSSLSGGAIAGIVIGSVVGLLILCGLAFMAFTAAGRREKKSNDSDLARGDAGKYGQHSETDSEPSTVEMHAVNSESEPASP